MWSRGVGAGGTTADIPHDFVDGVLFFVWFCFFYCLYATHSLCCNFSSDSVVVLNNSLVAEKPCQHTALCHLLGPDHSLQFHCKYSRITALCGRNWTLESTDTNCDRRD